MALAPSRRFELVTRIALAAMALAILVLPALPIGWFQPMDPSTGKPLLFLRSHTTPTRFNVLWAFSGFRDISVLVRAPLSVLPFAVTFVPARRWAVVTRSSRRFFATRSFGRRVGVAGVLMAGLFFLARVSPERNRTFADGPNLARHIEQGLGFPAEVLTSHAFVAVRALLAFLRLPADGTTAIAVSAAVCGGAFVSAILLFARSATPSSPSRAALVMGIVAVGSTCMFLGYMETTCLELAALAACFAAIARAARAPSPSITDDVVVLATSSVAVLAHGAGILVLPASLGFVLGRYVRRPAPDRLRVLAAFVLVMIAPFVAVIGVPFLSQGRFGNALGGGDGIMFVPWTFDPFTRPSPFVSYAMISWLHAADVANALLVAAPFAPLLLSSPGSMRATPPNVELLRWLTLLAGCCAIIPLTWNHDFGMWGDWNIAAAYFFPLHALAWCTAVARPGPEIDLRRARAWMGLTLGQAILALGLARKLY